MSHVSSNPNVQAGSVSSGTIEVSTNSMSYASKVSRAPTVVKTSAALVSDHQAIVLDSDGNVSLTEYCSAIKKHTSPSNVTHISRISQSRVCVYFKDAGIAAHFCVSVKEIEVGGKIFKVHPLVARNKKIIVSNVRPSLPDHVIVDELKKKGISTMSQLNSIKASVVDKEFAHVKSFRKQIYIKEEDLPKLPASAVFECNGILHNVFFTSDELSCFLCKKSGHLARDCTTSSVLQVFPALPQQDENMEVTLDPENVENVNPATLTTATTFQVVTKKRTRSTVSTIESTASPQHSGTGTFIEKKPTAKKVRAASPAGSIKESDSRDEDLAKLVKSLETKYKSADKNNQIDIDFLSMMVGNSSALDEMITEDMHDKDYFSKFVSSFQTLKNITDDKSLKNKIGSIVKRLKKKVSPASTTSRLLGPEVSMVSSVSLKSLSDIEP